MIILCTPDSVKRNWIHFEAGAAVVLDRKVGPLCFAGLNAGALPTPLNYICSQAIDSGDAEKFRKYFQGLLKEIGEKIGGDIPEINAT